MLPRFLVPDLDAARPAAQLPPGEAHHLARVLRLGPGADVIVFDGRGREYRAQVAIASRDVVEVTLVEPIDSAPMPAVALTVVQAVLKGDGMDGVVRDCTMVGARVIQPVVSTRTVVKAAGLSKAQDRWRRVALASAKQCGRSALPDVRSAQPFAQWLRQPRDGAAFLLVEPAVAGDAVKVRDLVHQPVPPSATLIVGPEGGWTPAEGRLAMAAGCRPLTLGRLTLRAETVALAAATALLAVWDV